MNRKKRGRGERKLWRRISREHMYFKKRMLSSSAADIYDSCSIIRFYESVYEYFMYEENISPGHVKACLGCRNVIESLYYLYTGDENLGYSTWDEIAEMLDVFSGVR